MKLNLGNQIRANRRRMNLTQEQLAEKFCTSAQAVSRWENGTTYPDIEMLPMIASFFGISVDSMLRCSEEEKKKFCADLQERFGDAVRRKDVEGAIALLREIRRNLREYQSYWFWGIYNEVWKVRLFRDEGFLEEFRMLTEDLLQLCPEEYTGGVVELMAAMEDDAHIDAFLDKYASAKDTERPALLFYRYKMREDMEKIEPVRMFILWQRIVDVISIPNDWQTYLCEDAAHWRWYCETQLNYLSAVNCLTPTRDAIVSGGCGVDLWCFERLILGMRYSVALAKLGEMDTAYDAFADSVALLERVMAMYTEDPFELGCTSPALEGFTLKSEFCWTEKKDGKEYLSLRMGSNDWDNWITPDLFKDALKNPWFDPMKSDSRFAPLFDRLKACIISRDKTEED